MLGLHKKFRTATRWILLIATIISLIATTQPAKAWDCTAYVFNVGLTGTVTVSNTSNQSETAQRADVYIDGVKIATLDVPALPAHTSATLGTVNVPDNGNFTWKVDGTKDCLDQGSYPEVEGQPTTCEDLGKNTIKTESDWTQAIKRGDTPFVKSYALPAGADFAIVNAGWEWTGSPAQYQTNEMHRIESVFGNTTSLDYGNEELAGQVVWFDTLAGPIGSSLDLLLAFAGNNSSYGSHNSHVVVSWCGTLPPEKHTLYVLDFNDVNMDGVRDADEELLSDWIVDWEYGGYTYAVGTLTTGSVMVGEFYAGETVTLTKATQTGWTDTTPNTVTVVMPDTDRTVEFGNYQDQTEPTKYKLYVQDFNDRDGSGAQGPEEELLAGWTVNWEYNNATHSLDTFGDRAALVGEFEAGETITLTKTSKTGWIDTTPNTITVTMPESDMTVAFGNMQPAPEAKYSLMVLDYHDLDGNGERTALEALLAGWTVNWEDGTQTVSLDTFADRPALVGQFYPGTTITLTKTLKQGWLDTTPTQVVVFMPEHDVVVEFGNYYTLPTFNALGNCNEGSYTTSNFAALDVTLWGGTGPVPLTNPALMAVQATDSTELLGTWNTPATSWTWAQMGRSSMNYTWLLYKAQGTDTRGNTYYFNQVVPLLCKSTLYFPIMCGKPDDGGEPECVDVFWQSGSRPINGSIGYTEPLHLWVNNTGNWTSAWWQVQVDGKNIFNTLVACGTDKCELTLPGPFKPGGLLTGAVQMWPDGEFTNCPFGAHIDP